MTLPHRIQKGLGLVCLLLVALVMAACGNLAEQPKLHSPYDESRAFGTAAREILPEAVAIGYLREDEHFYNGTIDGEFAETFPIPVTRELIEEGRIEYESYCTPCHGYAGYGNGVLSEEGFPAPASYHDREIREKPVGDYFDAITNGQNAMYSFASQVTPAERWAIIAYIRALQYSQNAPFADLPEDLQAQFTFTLE
ncbi:cytochrome c [bacterium]|nr:cytochrome c [bacterium]